MPTILQSIRLKLLFNAFLAFGLFFALGVATSFAVAPAGTMTGTAQSVTAGTMNAINAITVTDAGAEIDAATDIKIKIPAALNARWDTVDLTAAAHGGTGAAKVSTTVSYADSGLTLVLDVTADFLAGETLVVTGLSIIADAVSPASALTWAVDGSTYGTGNVNTAITVTVGDLTSTNVQPAILTPSQISNNTISFTTSALTPNLGIIKITYPSGWSVSNVAGTTATSLSGLDGTWTATVSGQVVTLTQTGGSITNAGAKSLTLSGVRTPAVTGSGGTYTILTEKADGTDIETDAAVTADTISGASESAAVEIADVTGVTITDDEETGGVMITWTDPDDTYSTFVQILKGTDPFPVSGTVYASVATGTGYYLDTDVEEGDVVSYMLRGTDGDTTGDLTEEVTFTVGSSASDTTDDTTDDSTDDSSDDTSDDSTDDSSDDTSDDSTDDSSDDTSDDSVSFSDTEDHWAAVEIEVAVSEGWVEGNPDGSFAPDANLNRAEAAAMLWRVLGFGDADDATEDPFSDVDMGEWFASYIAELKGLDLVDGNPDGTYEPSEEINRAEFLQLAMNVYLYLYEDMEDDSDDLMAGDPTDAYEDLDTAAWYEGVVTVATAWEFVSGSECDGGMCFNAGDSITRAEATKILYNMFAM